MSACTDAFSNPCCALQALDLQKRFGDHRPLRTARALVQHEHNAFTTQCSHQSPRSDGYKPVRLVVLYPRELLRGEDEEHKVASPKQSGRESRAAHASSTLLSALYTDAQRPMLATGKSSRAVAPNCIQTATRNQAKVRSKVGLKAHFRRPEIKSYLVEHVDVANMGRKTRGLWAVVLVGVWRGGGGMTGCSRATQADNTRSARTR